MANEIEALRSVVRKVFGPDEGINVDPEAMRDGDLWWCAAEAIETTEAERSAIDAALAGVAAGPQATPDPPSRDEQIATVECWGWSRDVSHTAWIPPGTPTYSIHISTSPLCTCMHEERQHDIVRGCSWIDCDCKRFDRVVAVPTDGPRMMQSIWPSRVGESTHVIDDEPTDHEDQP